MCIVTMSWQLTGGFRIGVTFFISNSILMLLWLQNLINSATTAQGHMVISLILQTHMFYFVGHQLRWDIKGCFFYIIADHQYHFLFFVCLEKMFTLYWFVSTFGFFWSSHRSCYTFVLVLLILCLWVNLFILFSLTVPLKFNFGSDMAWHILV